MPVTLPTAKIQPVSDLSGLTLLLYGPTKIGKSTWASQSPNPLFLATEPGLNHLERFEVTVDSWASLLEACALLAKGEHPYRTIVIDTVDNAYLMCRRFICEKNNITDPGDLEYGKGHALVNNEFHRVLTRLAQLPYGLFLISHAQDVEIKTRTGKFTKTVPTLPGKSRAIVLGLVDVVLYADMEVAPVGEDGSAAEETRVVRTKPSAAYEAGDRTGKLPAMLPLEYAAFAAAWTAARGKAPGNGTKPTVATPTALPSTNLVSVSQPTPESAELPRIRV
jgi:hypothetical protein